MRVWPVFFLLLTLAALPAGAEWVSVGPGGGGAMYAPAASPHDPDLMFVSCDMGGFYRSEDRGASWHMVSQKMMKGSTRCRPIFHPTDPAVVYTYSTGALRRSSDRGLSWSSLWATPGGQPILELAIDPDNPDLLFAGFADSVERSDDGGMSWLPVTGITGSSVGFFIDPTSDPARRAMLAGTSDGLFRSEDGGLSFGVLFETDVRGLAGGRDELLGSLAVFYTDSSGVHRSSDGVWFELVLDAAGDDLRFVALAQNQTAVVYVTSDAASSPLRYEAVYRSLEWGSRGTWENCFRGHPGLAEPNVEAGWITHDISWGWGGPAIGFNVSAAHPEVALYTDTGRTFITDDAGESWRQVYSEYRGPGEPMEGQPWSSVGLEVTSAWHLDFDPFELDRAYISYTDIGFARSFDWGASWVNSTGGCPWTNTFYQIVFDPVRPGVIWAACSTKHDIPFWSSTGPDTHDWPGGVCMSTDYGATWTPLSAGLPEAPATSIAIDPANPERLWVAMYGHGVYRTDDGGASWLPSSTGLDVAANSHVYSLKLHADGSLFCSKTGYRYTDSDFYDNSGLWRSDDGGESWTSLNGTIEGIAAGSSWAWAIDYAVHPDDSSIIYLAAFDCTAGRVQGGLYKTTDAGENWSRKHTSYRAFEPWLDPSDPEHVLLTTPQAGLWESPDGGESWTEVIGLPYLTPTRVTRDPRDAGTLFVTSFGGGVWRKTVRPPPPAGPILLVKDNTDLTIEWDAVPDASVIGYNVYRSDVAFDVSAARTKAELALFLQGPGEPSTSMSRWTDSLAGGGSLDFYNVRTLGESGALSER